MALTIGQVKAAKVPVGKKQIRLADSAGLYLQVTPSGKYWRMNYRFANKQKTLALGVYPVTSLKQARLARDCAKQLLTKGIDPGRAKKIDKRRNTQASISSFKAVSAEWISRNSKKWAKTTTRHTQDRLDKHILPWIGSLSITDIEVPDVLALIQKAEQRGTIETAHRLKMLCGQIFRYAVATGRIKSDPTRDLQGALMPVVNRHRATIVEPKAIGALMRAIEAFEGTFVVQCALQITPYLFVRPGELRHSEWSEINFETAEWRIPAKKMKMRVMHIVPLPTQVMTILKELHPLTGKGKYVFPSIRNSSRPMSENTINASLRRIGYDKSEICAHGFRAMASTILHEQGWNSDIIERQLAHKEGNAIKGAYNHARHLPERVKLMQQWADYLDGLRDGAEIIAINSGKA